MGSASKIEWTDASWTPIRARNTKTGKAGWHCVHMTEACRNCYAEALNKYIGTGLPYKPGHLSNGDVEMFLDEKMLLAPLRWKKPRKIFVCSMTDLFGDFVQEEWIDRMYAVMAMAPQHIYQVLTKRPDRMRDYFAARREGDPWAEAADAVADLAGIEDHPVVLEPKDIPLPNVWHGTSICDQEDANASMPHLIATPSAIRFVSHEPALGMVDWSAWSSGLDQIIDGGESGQKARPSHPDVFRANRDQCTKAGIFYFHKQNGAFATTGLAQRRWIVRPDGSHAPMPTPNGIGHHPPRDGATFVYRVGKKAAGAMLDGREWREMPT